MSERVIECPSCSKPLRVSEEAVGKIGHCSFCKTQFVVPAAGDAVVIVPKRNALRIPRALAFPAFGLTILGAAGMLVNGFLTLTFMQNPGADMEHAMLLLRQVRMEQDQVIQRPTDHWEHAPRAAIVGGAAAWSTRAVAENVEDERRARWMAPRMLAVHAASLGLSAATFLGGAAILFRRFRALAIFGCFAAALNVNHLCCFPGGILGLWGFLMLVRDESREFFRGA